MAATEGIYRRVSVRLWSDEKVGRLSPMQPSGQALWLYLLTGPHTGPIPGVFVVGRAALAEALDWDIEDFDRCAAELMAEGLVRFDKASRLWFIPNALRHNPPASPNVVTGWRTAWTLLPESPMRDAIAEAIMATLEASSKAFAEAFAKACGKASGKTPGTPSPNQDSGNRIQETGGEPAIPSGPALPNAAASAAEDSGGDAPMPRTGGARRPSKTSIPADFQVSDRVKAWAAKKGHDRLSEHLECFRDKCAAKGYLNVDWDAAFMGAIRDDWARLRSSDRFASPGGRKSSLDCEEQVT